MKKWIYPVAALGVLAISAWRWMPGASRSDSPSAQTVLESANVPPNDRAWLDEGFALYDAGKYAQAETVLLNGMKQQESVSAEVFYRLAVCASQQQKPQEAQWLAKAAEAGFRDYRRLLNDPKLKSFRAQYDFMAVYEDLMGYWGEDAGKALAEALWHFAPKRKHNIFTPSPEYLYASEAEKKALNPLAKRPKVDAAFASIVHGAGEAEFSRGGGNNFYHEMAYWHTKNYYAIIYMKEVTWSDELKPQRYFLVTFTPDGKFIDSQALTDRGPNTCQTVKLKGFDIQLEEYAVQWKTESDYSMKNIAGTTFLSKKTMRLNEDGTITAVAYQD